MNTNSPSIHNLSAIIILVFVFIYIASEALIDDRKTIPCFKLLHLQPPIVRFNKRLFLFVGAHQVKTTLTETCYYRARDLCWELFSVDIAGTQSAPNVIELLPWEMLGLSALVCICSVFDPLHGLTRPLLEIVIALEEQFEMFAG